MKISLIQGNMLCLAMTVFGVALSMVPGIPAKLLSFILLWYFPHCPAHYIVGRLVGIRFSHYFLTRSSIGKLGGIFEKLALPTLGIKVKEWGHSGRWARFFMFSAGVLASMSLPLIPAMTLYLEGQAWLLTLALLNIGFDLYFSPKVGDFRKALNSLRRKIKNHSLNIYRVESVHNDNVKCWDIYA